MYVPTIAVIVVLRHYLVQGVTRRSAAGGDRCDPRRRPAVFCRAILGIAGGPRSRVRSNICRTAWPILSGTNLLSFSFIWYQSLAQEIRDTWARMPSNLLGVPVFALLIWLHAPLWRYFARLVRSLSDPLHLRIVIAAISAVSAAYLVMFAIVFDYSRWISNWAVCMFLILHAVKALPASREVPPI